MRTFSVLEAGMAVAEVLHWIWVLIAPDIEGGAVVLVSARMTGLAVAACR